LETRSRTGGRRSWRVTCVPLLAAAVLAVIFVVPASAVTFDPRWGANYLTYGSCCGGASLDGTRAYIDVSSISPDSTECVLFASVVTDNDLAKQLEAGVVKCGATSVGLDTTCSIGSQGAPFVKYVERYTTYGTCYPHGAASLGSSYLSTVDDPAGNGTFYAYISGTAYEGQSGYDGTETLSEWGEHANGTSCPGWGGSGSFSTWQRYNYSLNTWTTVASSSIYGSAQGSCWSVSSVSSGYFTASH
jgi:hypothetical protein